MPHGDKPGAHEMRSHTTEDAPKRRLSGGTEQRLPLELSGFVTHRFALVGQMTGGIAHDFKNILAVIDSSLRLAETSSNEPCTFISGAREGVARGLALTSQLLDFTKQRDFQASAADANELLKALQVFLRYGAGSEVRVLLELSPNVPDCLIDPSQFNAAILNLVLNARDAMPRGGEIQISTELCVIQGDDSDVTARNYVRVRVRTMDWVCRTRCLKKYLSHSLPPRGNRVPGWAYLKWVPLCVTAADTCASLATWDEARRSTVLSSSAERPSHSSHRD